MGSQFHSSTLHLKIRTGVKEAKFLRNMSLHLSTLLPSHPVCTNTDQPGWATGTPLLSFHYLCSQIQPCTAKPLRRKGSLGAATGGPHMTRPPSESCSLVLPFSNSHQHARSHQKSKGMRAFCRFKDTANLL